MRSFCGRPCHPLPGNEAITSRFYETDATLMKCEGCGYRGFSPPPDEQLLAQAYQEGYYREKETLEQVNKAYGVDWEQYKRTAKHFLSVVSAIYSDNKIEKRSLRIHDVGCGTGIFVHGFNALGARATGTDLAVRPIARAKELGNKAVSDAKTEEFLAGCQEKMDMIFLSHFLEHALDPLALLKMLAEYLTDDGIFFIRVPNGLYVRALMAGYNSWGWCDYPFHMHYYTPKSFDCLFRHAGLRLIDVLSAPRETHPDLLAEQMFGRKPEQIIDLDSILQALGNNLMSCELQVIATKAGSPLKPSERTTQALNALKDESYIVTENGRLRNQCQQQTKFIEMAQQALQGAQQIIQRLEIEKAELLAEKNSRL